MRLAFWKLPFIQPAAILSNRRLVGAQIVCSISRYPSTGSGGCGSDYCPACLGLAARELMLATSCKCRLNPQPYEPDPPDSQNAFCPKLSDDGQTPELQFDNRIRSHRFTIAQYMNRYSVAFITPHKPRIHTNFLEATTLAEVKCTRIALQYFDRDRKISDRQSLF